MAFNDLNIKLIRWSRNNATNNNLAKAPISLFSSPMSSAPPATITQDNETSMIIDPPLNSADSQGNTCNPHTSSGSSSGTSAGDDHRSVRVRSLHSPAQSSTAANGESEPASQRGLLQATAAPVDGHVAEAGPVLTRVNPSQGPTSGGDGIDLIVSDLPPTVILFARFGCNIAPTSHFAPGVLVCNLPSATHPGKVNVTLCQAPSTDAEQYGRSLVSFEYVADTTKAVSLLLKLVAGDGKLLLESMPLIQSLLLRDAGSSRLEVEPGPLDSNMSLSSSLPESAFLDILSALKSLPEFPRLLATVNEQGQTLLHLAIYLRYRELVQKLVHWGIDLDVRDVNGFTALHAGYLCDDPFVVEFLEAEGATPFVLDELGRSPTELVASISRAAEITDGKDEGMVPLAVGYINSKEQCRLPDRATPAETQDTAFRPATEKDPPSETLSTVNEESELEREGGGLPAFTARNDKCVYLKHPLLSHINPRRGSTNGGEEIYLIVRNLAPTMKPYARFGPNITPTTRIADGVLCCVLPAAERPGVVHVTLCQEPSVHEDGHWRSLVSFEYQCDTFAASDFLLGNPQMDIQLESPFHDMALSGLPNYPYGTMNQYFRSTGVESIVGGNMGGNVRGNVGGPRAQIEFKLLRPKPTDEGPIDIRREQQIVLGISIIQTESPWTYIKLWGAAPEEHSEIPLRQAGPTLVLEVHGATTGRRIVSACYKCYTRFPSASPISSLFDFTAKGGLVGIEGGVARVAFRFRCMPFHHGGNDREYRLTATMWDGEEILARRTFSNNFRVVHHLRRRKAIPIAVLPGDPVRVDNCVDSEESRGAPPNARTSDGKESGTSAGECKYSISTQPSYTPAENPTARVFARTNEESNLEREGGGLPAFTTRNKHPVLSHITQRRGLMSGGEEIYLIVRNLAPTMKPYARFGPNITPTTHIADGVLCCVLPAAERPGVVHVTLCEKPWVHEDDYGGSLVSFEYRRDTSDPSASWYSFPTNPYSASSLLDSTRGMAAS